MQKTIYILLLLLLFPLFAILQKASFQFYTIADGLSHNNVHGLAQDQQGFLWIMTNETLNRFDENRFLNHTNSDHPVFSKNKRIGAIISDKEELYYFDHHRIVAVNITTGIEAIIDLDESVLDMKKRRYGQLKKLPNGQIIAIILIPEEEKIYAVWFKEKQVENVVSLQDIYADFGIESTAICGDGHGNLFTLTKIEMLSLRQALRVRF